MLLDGFARPYLRGGFVLKEIHLGFIEYWKYHKTIICTSATGTGVNTESDNYQYTVVPYREVGYIFSTSEALPLQYLG